MILPFPGSAPPPVAVAGGKGASLARMAAQGLPVPPGVVLCVAFFEPWMQALHATEAWRAFHADPGPETCAALQREATTLQLPPDRRAALDAALATLSPGRAIYAVRSSSPEEDLAGASFAGAYETVLGVTPSHVEAAIRTAFTSCLDARIVAYKRQRGFDPRRPRIAVVVQEQVPSDVAGVGFSVDPLDNDHDHIVLSANFGLGETVVSGTASPDHFVVDKGTGEVLERRVGQKETSTWLRPDGGTEERPDPRRDTLCLDDAQVRALAALVAEVEVLYGAPVDTEWAVHRDRLYLLQARPVTTHLQIPEALRTAPGAPRRLYIDLTTTVQGITEPLTPMSTSVLAVAMRCATREMFGRDLTTHIDTTLPYVVDGRLVLNASNLAAVAGLDHVAGFFQQLDPLAAAALSLADEDTYRSTRFGRGDLIPGFLARLPGRLLSAVEGRVRPEVARASAEAAIARWRDELPASEEGPLVPSVERLLDHTARLVLRELIPRLAMGRRALSALRSLAEGLPAEILDDLDRSLPGNVTAEMGLRLDALADALGPVDLDAPALVAAIDAGRVPADFARQWAELLAIYGHRGNRELELSTPRYREDASVLLGQILGQRGLPADRRPRALRATGVARREAARARLEEALAATSWAVRRRARSLLEVHLHLSGLRETHKFVVIEAFDRIRDEVRRRARVLEAAGRLEPDAVWDLHLADLDAAAADPALDLRAVAAERRAPHDRLAAVRELPAVFDSRGRILRPPPPPVREGELVGLPVSNGAARGRVKILAAPDEKPLQPGEILVARVTDPGWTPLFATAGAVVLEIGGVMQHGALVAREYGKPCVAGIQGVTRRLADGDLVEVDGTAGVVRLLADE